MKDRTSPRKTTNVQASPPPAPAEALTQTAPPAQAAAPRLSVGWKIALVVWVLAFGGLGAFELLNLAWKLLFR